MLQPHATRHCPGSSITRGAWPCSCWVGMKKQPRYLKTAGFFDAPLFLAVAYIRLGREADARAAVEGMLKSNPTLNSRIRAAGYTFSRPYRARPTLRSPCARRPSREPHSIAWRPASLQHHDGTGRHERYRGNVRDG